MSLSLLSTDMRLKLSFWVAALVVSIFFHFLLLESIHSKKSDKNDYFESREISLRLSSFQFSENSRFGVESRPDLEGKETFYNVKKPVYEEAKKSREDDGEFLSKSTNLIDDNKITKTSRKVETVSEKGKTDRVNDKVEGKRSSQPVKEKANLLPSSQHPQVTENNNKSHIAHQVPTEIQQAVSPNVRGDKEARRNAEKAYIDELNNWLARYQRYPRKAKRKNQQGVVEVKFTLNKQGEVLSYKILKNSGFQLLDLEAQKMLKRASPFPAIPPEMARGILTVTVPIAFQLQ